MPLECNAVFKGGGAKGIAYVGALEALEMWDVKCVEVAGSSAGAITATLVACGYTAAEVIELMPDALAQIDSVPTSMARFGIRSSLLSNERLHRWLKGVIAVKVKPPGYDPADPRQDPPDCTFRQVAERTTKDEAGKEKRVGVDLYVVTLDLSTRQPLVFCPKRTPESPVAAAVVASSAIPVAFPPARMSVNDVTHRLVDGGTWSNYPSFVFLDKDFRHWAGLEETNRTTIGFILDPPAPDPIDEPPESDVESEPLKSPSPVEGAPLITDRGSSTSELDLAGAIISSTLFRAAIALAPILFVLLSFFWVRSEFTGADPIIGVLGPEFQDVAMLTAFAVLSVTGVAAVVLAIVVLRLGRSLFDTGIVGATAAMGVGPSVPEWVGDRSERGSDDAIDSGTHVPDHVAVRIKVPKELTTLAFRADDETQEKARLQGRADTERELERVFGPPKKVASTDIEAIMAPEVARTEPPKRGLAHRVVMAPLDALGWVFEAVAKIVGKLLSWTVDKSIPRFVALAYAVVAGTGAAVNLMVGFGEGATWTNVVWILVVLTAALVAIWLVAETRRAEVERKTQYRYLGRLRRWPIALVAISVVSFVVALATAWNQLSFTDISLFTAVRAEGLSGEVVEVVDVDGDDGDADYLVVVDVTLIEQDEDAWLAFLEAFELNDLDSPLELYDLVGAEVEYGVTGDPFDPNSVAYFEFVSVNRAQSGAEVTVRIDPNPDRPLAYLENDLDEDLETAIRLQAAMIVGLGLLTVSFRSMRVARWASQQKKNAKPAARSTRGGTAIGSHER